MRVSDKGVDTLSKMNRIAGRKPLFTRFGVNKTKNIMRASTPFIVTAGNSVRLLNCSKFLQKRLENWKMSDRSKVRLLIAGDKGWFV